jgi:hypothetical protein
VDEVVHRFAVGCLEDELALLHDVTHLSPRNRTSGSSVSTAVAHQAGNEDGTHHNNELLV